MIGNPRSGWCEFNIGNFVGHPSDLTDVPVDLLQAFIDYRTKNSGCAYLDEEGTSFTLVLSDVSIFIIEEKEEAVLHDVSELNVCDLEEELLCDLSFDLDNWARFIVEIEENKIVKHKEQIVIMMEELERLRR